MKTVIILLIITAILILAVVLLVVMLLNNSKKNFLKIAKRNLGEPASLDQFFEKMGTNAGMIKSYTPHQTVRSAEMIFKPLPMKQKGYGLMYYPNKPNDLVYFKLVFMNGEDIHFDELYYLKNLKEIGYYLSSTP